MDDMRPKSFPTGIIFIIVGIILLGIGIVTYKYIGTQKYIETEDINLSFDGSQVSELDITSADSRLTVRTDEVDDITVSIANAPKGRYKASVSGGCLKVESVSAKWYSVSSRVTDKSCNTSIVITLPKKQYAKLSLDTAVGETNAAGISADDVCIDSGVGTAKFTDCQFGSMDCDCGVGDFTFNGKITDGLTADCGIGTCTFNLKGSYEDHFINADKGLGAINVQRGKTVGTLQEKIPLEIDCGIGEININFD